MNWIKNFVRPKIRSILGTDKREVPENMWVKDPDSGQMVFYKDLEANQFVMPPSNYHMRMPPEDRHQHVVHVLAVRAAVALLVVGVVVRHVVHRLDDLVLAEAVAPADHEDLVEQHQEFVELLLALGFSFQRLQRLVDNLFQDVRGARDHDHPAGDAQNHHELREVEQQNGLAAREHEAAEGGRDDDDGSDDDEHAASEKAAMAEANDRRENTADGRSTGTLQGR